MRIGFHQAALITILVFGLSYTAIAAEQQANTSTNVDMNRVFIPKDIQWSDAPNSLPKGAKIALLEGDPTKEGPFTMRLKFPADYRIPPHWHPAIEHVTVISGILYLGMGDKFDTKLAKALPVGAFAYMQPEMHHFAFTRGESIVQLHGIGPWAITYVDPKDDPRSKKETS